MKYMSSLSGFNTQSNNKPLKHFVNYLKIIEVLSNYFIFFGKFSTD